MSEVIPSFYSCPPWQLERRVERLRKLRALYEERLAAIEAELKELEALLKGEA